MNEQTWWFVSRASGMVAWVVLGATCLWGILLITRMLKPADRPAWLLDLHRWLGALAVATTLVHMAALVADNFVHFGWKELLVPNASPWKTGPVTWGIFAFYLLLIIEISSLLMKKMPRRLWHSIHLLSYVLFAIATVHGIQAGTDASNVMFIIIGSGGAAIVLFAGVARFLQARHKHMTKAEKAALLEDATR
jgi:DMSO/TMAO reductase YedYZ heme-binding membrane subunit